MKTAQAAEVKPWAELLNVGKGGASNKVDSLKMAAYHRASATRDLEKIGQAAKDLHAWMQSNSRLRATWTLFGGGAVYYNASVFMKTLKGFLDYGNDGGAVTAEQLSNTASQSIATAGMSKPGTGDLECLLKED